MCRMQFFYKGNDDVLLPTNKNFMSSICPVYWALALKSVTKGEGGGVGGGREVNMQALGEQV